MFLKRPCQLILSSVTPTFLFDFYKHEKQANGLLAVLICISLVMGRLSIFSCLLSIRIPFPVFLHLLLPCGSVGKESACNAADPGSIPGSGRSTGEGIGYRFQHSRAFLVAQLVNNPLAMWEAWVWFLGWDDPLEKGKATHSSILALEICMDCQWGGRVGHDWATFTLLFVVCWWQRSALHIPETDSLCNR